nr:TIGR04076 family protein [Anaerolineae bacterium]
MDEFELYDLKVSIEQINGNCTCDHKIGDYFEMKGGKVHLPAGQPFCLYAMQAAIPLLPAKQRPFPERHLYLRTFNEFSVPGVLATLWLVVTQPFSLFFQGLTLQP